MERISDSDDALSDSDFESHANENYHDELFNLINEEWVDSLRILKGVIVQLPNANRDSLSFLFIHLRRLIDAPLVANMNVESVAKIFGPLIVGGSRSTMRPAPAEIAREKELQVMVMKALFKLSPSFWEGLLKDPNFSPFGKLSIGLRQTYSD